MRIHAKILAQVVLSTVLSTSFVLGSYVQRRATVCNGHAELCDRSFGNVTFVGAHNSYAVGINDLSTNQDYDVTQQLTDGVRMLQMQAHNLSGTIQLCHTACSLYNGGTLNDYLVKVKTWMNANPTEVVSLLIVNSDNLAPTEFDAVFKSAGVDTMSYSPPSASLQQDAWPTLGTLIDSGKTLVAFLSTTADFTSVPYLIDEFSNMWETAFDVVDPAFDCNVNRSRGDTSTQMYLINHFLDQPFAGIAAIPVPFRDHANITNAASGAGSLGEQVATCVSDHTKNPNFLLVDFYEYGGGSVFQVAATANGVTYNPTTPIATPISETSTSTTSTTSSGSSSGAIGLLAISQPQFYSVMFVASSVIFGALSVL
ncbi:PLC-like phosphodiesterase [Abortiporus biennis]|nr:PLC-like phosphodiesterase [Abortiporus biennis]